MTCSVRSKAVSSPALCRRPASIFSPSPSSPSPRMSSGLNLSISTRLAVGSSSQMMILACLGLKWRWDAGPSSLPLWVGRVLKPLGRCGAPVEAEYAHGPGSRTAPNRPPGASECTRTRRNGGTGTLGCPTGAHRDSCRSAALCGPAREPRATSDRTHSPVEVRGHLRRLVRRIRRHWPQIRITIRGLVRRPGRYRDRAPCYTCARTCNRDASKDKIRSEFC
jgi:hypothetical protein